MFVAQTKTLMPESRHCHSSGSLMCSYMLHRESGYITEIATKVALQRGVHVVVDGSLRNFDFHRLQMADMRASFPQYRLAIVYVTAETSVVLARAHARESVTGRHIAEKELLDCISQVGRVLWPPQ